MHQWLVLLIGLVTLTDLHHDLIGLNPTEIVSIRAPHGHQVYGKGTRCVVFLTDMKFTAVRETCAEVRTRTEHALKG